MLAHKSPLKTSICISSTLFHICLDLINRLRHMLRFLFTQKRSNDSPRTLRPSKTNQSPPQKKRENSHTCCGLGPNK